MAAADDPPTLKLLTDLAAKLSDGNLPGALGAFSNKMLGYDDLAVDLGALTAQYETICTIEIKTESGDGNRRQAETEWFVQMKSKQQDGPTERRTVTVRITTERSGNKWRITSMEPRQILTPPQVR